MAQASCVSPERAAAPAPADPAPASVYPPWVADSTGQRALEVFVSNRYNQARAIPIYKLGPGGGHEEREMTEQPVVERRKHQRYPLSTSVEFHHGPSQRDFLGRCVDVSSGGMRMYVPPNAPVQAGHPISVNAGSVNRPELGLVGDEPVSATITRVERTGLVPEGNLAVGVRFSVATA